MSNTKLAKLSEDELKQFYRALCKEITQFIGDFFDCEEDLQEAFKEFKSDTSEYHDVLDNILANISPQYKLTWRDLKHLSHKRIRLCRVCGKPFISYDKYNRIRICYDTPYKRYISDGDNGHYVKYTEEGQSACYAKRRRQIT
jgi:protein-arginine kinase activator protein McsA